MKKTTKLIILAITLVLICGVLVIAASAGSESEFKWQFTDDATGDTVYTDEFASAVENAKAGSTVKLLSDVEIISSGKIVIDKSITVDLGGHTLYLSQGAKEGGFAPADNKIVKFANGTIVAATNANYDANYATNKKAHAIFSAIGKSATVKLENVNTYGYAVAYSWGNPYTISISGGEHHSYTAQIDHTYPGWICGNNNITASVENASIYLTHTDARLVGFQSYKANAATAKSSAVFNNCKIIGSSADHNIISGLNRYSTVSFTGCDIYGKLAPGGTGHDTSKYNSTFSDTDKNPVDGAVRLGAGCRVSKNVTGNSVVAWAEDVTVYDLEANGKTATVTLTPNSPSGYYTTGDFKISPSSVTVAYTSCDKALVVPKNLYKVVNGTDEKYYTDSVKLSDVISEAAAGSTIYLLADHTEVTDRYENPNKAGEYVATSIPITKQLTFDLGGHTITIEQHAKNCGFYIRTTAPVVFKNGTVATVAHNEYNSSGRTFAFANVSTGGANITFDGISSSVSSLIYSYGSTFTLNIKGGIHNLNSNPGDMNTSGFVAGQSNSSVTVTDATIYAYQRSILGASSYRALSNGLTPNSTFTFDGCKIIASSATANIMGNLNEYTKVYFNGCHVLGSMTPSLNASDASNGVATATSDNIVIGEGTFFSSDSNLLQSTTLSDNNTVQRVGESISLGGFLYGFDRVVDCLRVIWFDENGNELKSIKIRSSDITLDELAPEYEGTGGAANGWYKIGGFVANSWTCAQGGVDAVDLSAIKLSDLTESLSLYPLVDEARISAGLTAAMYNLSTVGAIRSNLYFPEAPDNVEIIGVYVGEREIRGRLVVYHDYTNAPVYYTMYVIGEVGATEFTRTTDVTVKYRVNGNIDLEQEYTISALEYASAVYEDSQRTEGNVYNEQAYRVVADLVRYSYMLSVYVGNTDAELTALYDKMAQLCSELPSDNSLAGSLTNAFTLSGIGSIAYEASSYEPRWRLTLNESAAITGVRITLQGYTVGANADRTNFGELTYGIEDVVRGESGYITTAYTENIPIYNITQPFTVTVTKADGTEISGTYDLKSYYAAIGKNTEAADFIKAVVALSDSSLAYKFPGGRVTADDIRDFWECDHTGALLRENIVAYTYNFHPRYCVKCDSWLFCYEDYGAVADGKTNRTRATHVSGTNDYEAIYWTHANANEWKARADLSLGKHVAVVGNLDPDNAKYYYISLPEGRGIYTVDINRDGIPETTYTGQNLGSVTVATDTSWNGVHFIVDDDTICNASGCSCTNSVGVARKHAYNGQAIFKVEEYGAENYAESLLGKISSLSAGATNIGYAPGRKMLVQLTDSNKKIYFRYGSNASNGASVTEVILVDEFGNIDPSTPVQWDYATLTTAYAYAVDTDPIKISGLNGDEINSSFESYVNNSLSISIPHYVSCGRNISITRSNATVEGIERFFTEEPANSNVTNKRFAYTFIVVNLCSNATVKDMLVINHNSQSGESGVGQGSYEFSGGSANAVSWINCVTKNMFSNSKAGALQAYPIYRGLFGTNHIRNMYLKDCYLNSFDAHTGAYNVTLEDTTVEHMNFIGGGDINIKNVTVYTSSQGMAFNLRTDYGSTWRGDVYIDGLTIKYATASGYKPSRLTIFKGSYENQYWGFDTYTPQNVVINDLHTQAYTATVSGGVRTETAGAVDDANMKVYYYYALNSLSAAEVPDESKAGIHGPKDKGDPNITYDYGTNHLEVTKNLTITNSVDIIIPVGSVWKDMNVTVDGRIKRWSGGTDSGTWS